MDYAIHIAQKEKAKLLLITVVEPIPPLAYSSPGGPPTYMSQLEQDLFEEATSMQNRHIERLKKAYPELDVEGTVKEGIASSVIKNFSMGSDLIIIGHRGQGRLISLLLGSVAKEVVDGCSVPVLIVKDKDYCKPGSNVLYGSCSYWRE